MSTSGSSTFPTITSSETALIVGCAAMPRRANIRTGSACNLPATFPYVAGVARSEHWHSRSLLPTLHGEEDRDFAYCEWDLSDSHRIVPVNLRTVRTRRDKLTVETILGTVEIYDLEADPLEMNNIADDPRHAARRRELEAMIAQRPDDARKERLPAVGMA